MEFKRKMIAEILKRKSLPIYHLNITLSNLLHSSCFILKGLLHRI